MCRSEVIVTDPARLLELFDVRKGPTPNLRPRWNLCPTDPGPIVRIDEAGDRRLEAAIWDYRDDKVTELKGRRPLINVQGERFKSSRAFETRRCLVPTNGFYEFARINGKPQPFLFRREDWGVFAFGGAWSMWQGPQETKLTYTLLTTAPGKLVAEVHERMSLVIDEADWETWLTGTKAQAAELVRPNPLAGFVRYPVSTRANSVRNDDPSLVEPIQLDGELALL
jgi:putative SOS response-associated peptidase YedK